MKTTCKRSFRIAFLLALLLCMAASAALAADAVTVELNNVTLNAASPYWKNGGGGSETDWNAYFDTGTPVPTLYLKDALITTMNASDELIYADGDLHIVLLGANELSYAGPDTDQPAGIVADGDIVISDGTTDGTGSLTIDIVSTFFLSIADGILTDYGNITIESGTIDISLLSGYVAFGLYAEDDLYIRGGETTVYSAAPAVSAVSVFYLNMTGGSITSTAVGEYFGSHALLFYQILTTGGSGRFVNGGNGFCGIWAFPEIGFFRVLDGQMIFANLYSEALYFDTDQAFVPTVTDRIYAATDFSGAGKFVWDPLKGSLAANAAGGSDFQYVELLGDGSSLPDTGDENNPWLWGIIGLAALLAGTGAYVLLRRKRRK